MTSRLEELREELDEESNVIDNVDDESSAEAEQINYPQKFSISSFGADYDVRGLVQRLNEKSIVIPSFQRNYVWNIVDASKFIESLLLGLPVPGIFLAKDLNSNKLLVIDGQQRLKSLQFFYAGYFNPKESESTSRVFKLKGVKEQYSGMRYQDLNQDTRILLDNSIIHATIIKQDSPENDDTSIYYVFERINSGGRILTPQEIRTAAFHGSLIHLLSELNTNEHWRAIYGKPNSRLKDHELILRFFALYSGYDKYKKPLKTFINTYCAKNRSLTNTEIPALRYRFERAINKIHQAIGDKAFRPENALNAAVFDSIMIAVAKRLEKGDINNSLLKNTYNELLSSSEFKKYITQSTSDENAVIGRIKMAIESISSI